MQVELPPGYRVCAPKHQSRKGGRRSKAIYCHKVKPEYRDGEPVFRMHKGKMTNQCVECGKKTSQRYYQAKREAHIERTTKWKQAHSERVKQYKRTPRRELTEQEREDRRQYMRDYYERNGEEMRRKNAERKERKKMEARADIPAPVIRPYVELAVRHYGIEVTASRGRPFDEGTQELARRLEVEVEYIGAIRHDSRRAVSLDFVDRLAILQGLFDLDEIRDRAREWATLTGASWPEDYQPRTRGFRELRKPRKRKRAKTDTLAKAA